MCGIAGIVDLTGRGRVAREPVERMTRTLVHRGPDSEGYHVEPGVALGMRRLSIIDLDGGDQPIANEDGSLVLVCNGEVFDYRRLRRELAERGHRFATGTDVEVLVHLYEESGTDFLAGLDGQLACALLDRRRRRLILARDQMGINPLFYACFDGFFLFGSEIKALLAHPAVPRAVDLTGLDQVLTFPGLVSPRTMFEGVSSLPAGHLVEVDLESGRFDVSEYWDLVYPRLDEEVEERDDQEWIDEVRDRFFEAVRQRLVADVPVGFYLSGGLDSALLASVIHRVAPSHDRHSFSVDFREQHMSERANQLLVAEAVGSIHNAVPFGLEETVGSLARMVSFTECPVKETYDTCTLALSRAARERGVPVVLTGEGADELFAGYVGYRFDQQGSRQRPAGGLEAVLEEEARERLWGDRQFVYELDYHQHGELRESLYGPAVRARFHEIDCTRHPVVAKERLEGRHPIHKRSYIDYRLRLSDHLLGDHGDRMALASSVEGRHPFLALDLVELSTRIPPRLKVHNLQEKYVLRQAAVGLVPERIRQREKFGWFSSGTPAMLQAGVSWVEERLSPERVCREGYFDPEVIDHLRGRYARRGFELAQPFESDLLMIALTFSLFLELFDMPTLG